MFDPFDRDEEEAAKPRPPFPTPTGALLLTFGASIASLIVAVLLFEQIDLLALGVGEAFGVGGVATWAARRVPEPQAERLGLRGFTPRLIPVLLCLVPLVFVTSELDNWGRDIDAALPPLGIEEALQTTPPAADEGDAAEGGSAANEEADATALDDSVAPPAASADTGAAAEPADSAETGAAPEPADSAATDAAPKLLEDETTTPIPLVTEVPEGWALAQIAIVTLGISPVVEGFLFFGVILQGLVTWLGRRRGLLLTACLYAMIHAFGRAGPDAGLAQALFAVVSIVVMGVCLGVTRLATGSVLAPILVDTAFKGVALLALASPDVLAVPGYNVELDSHTPLSLVIPAAGTAAWALWVLTRWQRRSP